MNNSPTYTPPNVVLAGIMAFLPLIATAVYVIVFVSFFLDLASDLEQRTNYITDDSFEQYFLSIFMGIFLVGALSLVSLIYFLVIITRNPALNSEMRLVWVLLSIFGGLIANIVYLFMYIVPQNRGEQPLV
jgi:prolipoprotein diacylglyceryltransferase